jgi:hypothetical protein
MHTAQQSGHWSSDSWESGTSERLPVERHSEVKTVWDARARVAPQQHTVAERGQPGSGMYGSAGVDAPIASEGVARTPPVSGTRTYSPAARYASSSTLRTAEPSVRATSVKVDWAPAARSSR